MGVTLQQIAEAANVSRGTVDRALNNRGRINPAVAEKIRKIAKDMGYQPNRAGRALALAKQGIRIGIVLQAMSTPFMHKLKTGILEAKEEVGRFGVDVLIREYEGQSVDNTLKGMEELRQAGCAGIIIMGSDDERLIDKIHQYAEESVPVITFNSDVEHSERVCYIGQESRRSGRVAAGLMAEILPPDSGVAVFSGYPLNHSHSNRAKGFLCEIEKSRQDITVLDIRYVYDSNLRAEEITNELLQKYSDFRGIYVAAAGVQGVCDALEKAGKSDCIKVISTDLTDENIERMKKGSINFLIGQDALAQGHEPVMRMFSLLVDGVHPEREKLFTDIVIKTKYNA